MKLLLVFSIFVLISAIRGDEPEEPSSVLAQSLRGLLPGSRRDIVIELEPQLGSVLTAPEIVGLPVGQARKDRIISLLRQKTSLTQGPVLLMLESLGLSERSQSFWIANRIYVKNVDIGAISALSKLPVPGLLIREPVKVKIYPVVADEQVNPSEKEEEIEVRGDQIQWGVEKIGAPKVWEMGVRGEGVTVGIIDTGVNAGHKDLKDNYRDGGNSWFDAFYMYDKPYDGNGHGTHCTGSMCGANGVGVAPGAKWMGCRGLDDEGSADDSTLVACGQFMACPNDPPKKNMTSNSTMVSDSCKGQPDVVSNSWGGLIGGLPFYNEIISTWRALGMTPVFALGNSGPLCMTAGSPGDQPNVIAVGATDIKDKIAGFSSRGPATLTSRSKPEVSAPGKDIISCTHDSNTGYRKLSGTSMACPHVAGATALLLQAKNNATFDDILKILQDSSHQPKLFFTDSPTICTVPPKFPNNGYGSGRIDIQKAVETIKNPSQAAAA